jgi:hypothetical protein
MLLANAITLSTPLIICARILNTHCSAPQGRRQSDGFSLDKLDAFASQGFKAQQAAGAANGVGQPAYSNVPLSQIPTKRESLLCGLAADYIASASALCDSLQHISQYCCRITYLYEREQFVRHSHIVDYYYCKPCNTSMLQGGLQQHLIVLHHITSLCNSQQLQQWTHLQLLCSR